MGPQAGDAPSRATTRPMAATLRSTSASVVSWPLRETRITAWPCQVLPESQQVPSAWTPATTRRVKASASPPPGG